MTRLFNRAAVAAMSSVSTQAQQNARFGSVRTGQITKGEMKDAPNLDFLRAVAVLSVFWRHLAWRVGVRSNALLNLAHLGVVLFFVHTALVLMFSLERLSAVGQKRLVARFYVRRAFRVYPLAAATVIAVFAFYESSGVHWRHPLKLFISNLLLIQNISHWGLISDPLWSLPFEVQMYLLLPFLFLLLRLPQLPRLGVAGLLYVIGLILSQMLPIARYFPCFLGGVVAYVLWPVAAPRFKWLWWPVVLFLISILYSLYGKRGRSDWITALALGLAIPTFRQIRWRWLSGVAKTIAQYSYGIYLSHSPVSGLIFGRHWPAAVTWSIFLLLAAVIPLIAYYALEAPMIRLGAHWAESLRGNMPAAEAKTMEA